MAENPGLSAVVANNRDVADLHREIGQRRDGSDNVLLRYKVVNRDA